MAYSRQYLEEQRWREQNEAQWQGRRIRPLPKKVSSLPSLAYNYGGRPIESATQQQQLHDAHFPPLTAGKTKRKYRSFQSSESLCSLASIQEDSDDIVFSSRKASA